MMTAHDRAEQAFASHMIGLRLSSTDVDGIRLACEAAIMAAERDVLDEVLGIRLSSSYRAVDTLLDKVRQLREDRANPGCETKPKLGAALDPAQSVKIQGDGIGYWWWTCNHISHKYGQASGVPIPDYDKAVRNAQSHSRREHGLYATREEVGAV